jgi:hypothetical protein
VSLDSYAVEALTSSTDTWHNGATFSEWDWSGSNMGWATGWPNMYQAGGNGSGVHWIYHETYGYCHNADGGASGTYNLISATWVR